MSSVAEIVKQLGEQIVKRKAKKIAAFVSMLEDPDLQELVSALRNGDALPTPPAPEIPKHKLSAGLQASIIGLRPQLPKKFAAADVQKRLEEKAFHFNSDDHRSAVRDALFRLVQGEQLRVAEPGRGGKSSIYEWA